MRSLLVFILDRLETLITARVETLNCTKIKYLFLILTLLITTCPKSLSNPDCYALLVSKVFKVCENLSTFLQKATSSKEDEKAQLEAIQSVFHSIKAIMAVGLSSGKDAMSGQLTVHLLPLLLGSLIKQSRSTAFSGVSKQYMAECVQCTSAFVLLALKTSVGTEVLSCALPVFAVCLTSTTQPAIRSLIVASCLQWIGQDAGAAKSVLSGLESSKLGMPMKLALEAAIREHMANSATINPGNEFQIQSRSQQVANDAKRTIQLKTDFAM